LTTIREGDRFPADTTLGDLGGRLGRTALVLFFYPAALTGG